MVTIKHLSVRDIADAGVFVGVSNYDELIAAIVKYGGPTSTESECDAYNERVGAAFEVYNEFFLARYGTEANPHLAILNVEHTSQNKYQVGYDFTGTDFSGNRVFIQSKFRGNPLHKFTRSELGTFVSISDEEGIPAKCRVLFTNIEHKVNDDSNGMFDRSYAGGLKQMRSFDRIAQESFIIRDATFWSDLLLSVEESAKAPSVGVAPPMWEHQQEMYMSCALIMRLEKDRGRIICALRS
jgi:hypothetical protein